MKENAANGTVDRLASTLPLRWLYIPPCGGGGNDGPRSATSPLVWSPFNVSLELLNRGSFDVAIVYVHRAGRLAER